MLETPKTPSVKIMSSSPWGQKFSISIFVGLMLLKMTGQIQCQKNKIQNILKGLRPSKLILSTKICIFALIYRFHQNILNFGFFR